MIIAIVLVVGALGVFIALSGGNKKDNGPKPQPNTPPPTHQPDKPTVPNGPPARPPPPKIGNDIFSQGRTIINTQIKAEYTTASNLYDDAQLVKDDDPDEWQAMLREANEHMGAITDYWNEIVGLMPPATDDWDEEDIADHYFGKLYQAVGQIDQLKMAIRKNIRTK